MTFTEGSNCVLSKHQLVLHIHILDHRACIFNDKNVTISLWSLCEPMKSLLPKHSDLFYLFVLQNHLIFYQTENTIFYN